MNEYEKIISAFKEKNESRKKKDTEISARIRSLHKEKYGSSYELKNIFVFNRDLENVEPGEIRFILVGDNPGREEQLEERYLIGRAGKSMRKFLTENGLSTSPEKEILILNKTVIHTPVTDDLKILRGCPAAEEIQRETASIIFELSEKLGLPVWITGYSQLKNNGVFSVFAEELRRLFEESPEKLLLFMHFSRSCFLTDYRKNCRQDLSVSENLTEIGSSHRRNILGF